MAASAALDDVDWYWKGAEKAEIAEVLALEPDGSFNVRDASTQGDYTLTVKCNGHLRLIKILVRNEKCGFSQEMLNHDNVVQLIHYHKDKSLKSFNELLDVCLTNPISKSAWKEHQENKKKFDSNKNPPTPPEDECENDVTHDDWTTNLALEKLLIIITEYLRAARLYELAHNDRNRAELFKFSINRKKSDLQKKMEMFTEILKTQTIIEENDPEDAIVEGIDNAKANLVDTLNDMTAKEMDERNSQVGMLEDVMEDIIKADQDEEERHNRYLEIKNSYIAKLTKQGVPRQRIQATLESAKLRFQKEPLAVSQLLIPIERKWDPSSYLVNDSNKDIATDLLNQARERKNGKSSDGIFLIRPSSTQTDKLVLSVFYDNNHLAHCLIEQTENGWGFQNGGLYFVTIGDFVRYYSQISLEEHSKPIKTPLTMPAMLGTNSNSNTANSTLKT